MSTPTGSVGIFGLNGAVVLGFGPTGIQFNPTVTTPSGSGQFKWAQFITNDAYGLTTTGGTVQSCVDVTAPPTTTGTGLDSGWPYTTGSSTHDSPAVALESSAYKKESRSFSATMYLLWNPLLPSSIDVPLGSVSWGFSGAATYTPGSCTSTSNWCLTSNSKTTPTWTPSSTYPDPWSDYVPFVLGFPNGLSCP